MIKFEFRKEVSGSQGSLKLELEGAVLPGQFITLSGDSGAGKTTFLRMMAGLTNPDDGSLIVNETIWYSNKENISTKPQHRSTAMVFQDLALFPNMTAENNIQFASKHKQQSDIDELISIMELSELRNRKPGQLSRGQQQRVAIARAIAQDPQILLLDEPFSALDNKLKSTLLEYLKKIHQNYNLTTILVTHNPDITKDISDVHWRLEDGKITIEKLSSSTEDYITIESMEKKDGKYVITVDASKVLQLKLGTRLKKV